MRSVAVVSDTTGYLPRELAAANGIELLSLYVDFGDGKVEPEVALSDLDAFYYELCSAERLPTTCEPSVEDFVAAYRPLLDDGRDVVSIHISGALSATCEAAREAARRLEREGRGGERVHVVDSTTAGGGVGVIALAAARGAAGGDAVEAVLRRAEHAREEWKMWCFLDTLEFLRRGGRIGPLRSWIGSTLKVKSIVTVEGEVRPIERVRTHERAVERMVDYARQRHESGADAWVVQHSQWPAEAAELIESCREVFGTGPVYVSEIGPVVGVHTGPGLLGVGALPARCLA